MAHILVVDDEALVREALTSAIQNKGHTVVAASTGVEGLKRFAEQPFDLVITDIIMPDKEGIETIREMKRLKPDAKILAISGGGRTKNFEFLKLAAKFGAMAVLQKPIKLTLFYDTLNKCLDEDLAA